MKKYKGSFWVVGESCRSWIWTTLFYKKSEAEKVRKHLQKTIANKLATFMVDVKEVK